MKKMIIVSEHADIQHFFCLMWTQIITKKLPARSYLSSRPWWQKHIIQCWGQSTNCSIEWMYFLPNLHFLLSWTVKITCTKNRSAALRNWKHCNTKTTSIHCLWLHFCPQLSAMRVQDVWVYKYIKVNEWLESMKACVCCTYDYVRMHASYIQIQAAADK